MKNIMGIILTGGKNNRLKELTDIRSSSAIPVGGKFRAIDFVLSNMVNSGINNVGVLTQYSFRSLMDHLGSGKEWDLDRRNNGLFIFPPYLSGDESGWYRGSADAMYNNISFLKRSDEEYVVISQGNCIYKINFGDVVKYHKEKNADITIVYREMSDFPAEDLQMMGIMEVNENARVLDFQEKPLKPRTNLGSMGIYVIKRELLINILEECAAHGNYDFVKDVLVKKADVLNIMGYKFNGYWRSMHTVQQYFRCNMEMLKPEIRNELFIEGGSIYTKVKDEPPAKYNDEAEVKNSIIADGCIIEGYVENSVLFRGVMVKKGAIITDSIVMQGSVIEEDAYLQNAILDKDVVLTRNKFLRGEPNCPITVAKDSKV